jgi:hypothetical protein
MLDVASVRDDPRLVPLADRARGLGRRRRYQVVERRERAVAFAALLRVRMPRVVEQLELEPDRRALGPC